MPAPENDSCGNFVESENLKFIMYANLQTHPEVGTGLVVQAALDSSTQRFMKNACKNLLPDFALRFPVGRRVLLRNLLIFISEDDLFSFSETLVAEAQSKPFNVVYERRFSKLEDSRNCS